MSLPPASASDQKGSDRVATGVSSDERQSATMLDFLRLQIPYIDQHLAILRRPRRPLGGPLREAMGSPKKITPHTLRHSLTTQGIEAGAPLLSVSEMLDHASIATTQWYIHLSDTHRRDAVRRIESTVPMGVLPRPPIEKAAKGPPSVHSEASPSSPPPALGRRRVMSRANVQAAK